MNVGFWYEYVVWRKLGIGGSEILWFDVDLCRRVGWWCCECCFGCFVLYCCEDFGDVLVVVVVVCFRMFLFFGEVCGVLVFVFIIFLYIRYLLMGSMVFFFRELFSYCSFRILIVEGLYFLIDFFEFNFCFFGDGVLLLFLLFVILIVRCLIGFVLSFVCWSLNCVFFGFDMCFSIILVLWILYVSDGIFFFIFSSCFGWRWVGRRKMGGNLRGMIEVFVVWVVCFV